MSYDLDNILMIKDVPAEWVFKTYSKDYFDVTIYQPFDGRTIKIKSFYNNDSTPSLCFYYKRETNEYLFDDKSLGKGGDKIDFVRYIRNCDRAVAINDIREEYQNYLLDPNNIPKETKIKQLSRPWFNVVRQFGLYETILDYFKEYKITAKTLREYNVIGISFYEVIKTIIDSTGREFEDKKAYYYKHMFAFQRLMGSSLKIYQIYQPGTEPKYMDVDLSDYLIGYDQLDYHSETVIITSGLKDLMALHEVGLDIDIVALPTERAVLRKDFYDHLDKNYKFIITILDNDEAGLKAMIRHKNIYGIPYIHLKEFKKDLADNNKEYDLEYLKLEYARRIDKIINGQPSNVS